MQIATYVVQSLNAQLGVLMCQIRNKISALLIHQDLSQGSDGLPLVASAGNISPKPPVIVVHGS